MTSTNITKANLIQAFENAVRCAIAAGIDTEGWNLQIGSGNQGAAYRLQSRTLDERLGSTRGEAYDRLHAMARAWQMVVWSMDAARGFETMKAEARKLPIEDLRRHASVSMNNFHRCTECFTCAAAAVLVERQKVTTS